MKTATYEQLLSFRDRLNISHDNLIALNTYKECFISRKDEFAQRFYDYFMKIEEAKPILEYVTMPDILHKTWASWFTSLFRDTVDDEYLKYLWDIGKRHAERNIEQRVTILGFTIIRQYMHEIVSTSIASEKSSEIMETINKLLDLCLFAMTTSYFETTTHCEIELIRGIADKLRNPVTVIGGNIHRLKRKASQYSPSEFFDYDALLEENDKIERIIQDAKIYLDLFEEDPKFTNIPIAELLHNSLEALLVETSIENIKIDIQADPSFPYIKADQKHIEQIFRSVLKNSLEALNRADPQIRIKTTLDKNTLRNLLIEIFNTGTPTKQEDMEKVFTPFFSTKTTGTGFGLPIAQLALRKNYGKMQMKPIPRQGTMITISIPLPD
jgi:signal transduction histidine kinase